MRGLGRRVKVLNLPKPEPRNPDPTPTHLSWPQIQPKSQTLLTLNSVPDPILDTSTPVLCTQTPNPQRRSPKHPKPQSAKQPLRPKAPKPQSSKALKPTPQKKTPLPAPKSFVTRVILVQGPPETPTLCVLCRGHLKNLRTRGGGGGLRGLIRFIRVSGGAFVQVGL